MRWRPGCVPWSRLALPVILESVLSDSKGLRRHFGSLSRVDRAIQLVESWPPLGDLLAPHCVTGLRVGGRFYLQNSIETQCSIC